MAVPANSSRGCAVAYALPPARTSTGSRGHPGGTSGCPQSWKAPPCMDTGPGRARRNSLPLRNIVCDGVLCFRASPQSRCLHARSADFPCFSCETPNGSGAEASVMNCQEHSPCCRRGFLLTVNRTGVVSCRSFPGRTEAPKHGPPWVRTGKSLGTHCSQTQPFEIPRGTS